MLTVSSVEESCSNSQTHRCCEHCNSDSENSGSLLNEYPFYTSNKCIIEDHSYLFLISFLYFIRHPISYTFSNSGNPSQSQEPQLPHRSKTSLVQANSTTAKNFNFTMPRDPPPHVIPVTQLTPNGVKDPPLPPPQDLPSHEIQPLTE